MAFAAGKAYPILLQMSETNPEAKKLLDDLNNISQEEYTTRMGKLLQTNPNLKNAMESKDKLPKKEHENAKKPEEGNLEKLVKNPPTKDYAEMLNTIKNDGLRKAFQEHVYAPNKEALKQMNIDIINNYYNKNPEFIETLVKVFDIAPIKVDSSDNCSYYRPFTNSITLWGNGELTRTLVHEVGHYVDWNMGKTLKEKGLINVESWRSAKISEHWIHPVKKKTLWQMAKKELTDFLYKGEGYQAVINEVFANVAEIETDIQTRIINKQTGERVPKAYALSRHLFIKKKRHDITDDDIINQIDTNLVPKETIDRIREKALKPGDTLIEESSKWVKGETGKDSEIVYSYVDKSYPEYSSDVEILVNAFNKIIPKIKEQKRNNFESVFVGDKRRYYLQKHFLLSNLGVNKISNQIADIMTAVFPDMYNKGTKNCHAASYMKGPNGKGASELFAYLHEAQFETEFSNDKRHREQMRKYLPETMAMFDDLYKILKEDDNILNKHHEDI